MNTSVLSAPDVRTVGPPERALRGIRRMLRGPADQPGWHRPAVQALLVGTAVLYLWGLGASGNANQFYAAAVQAGTRSWKAFLFGSVDWGNFITVDKPPASLWVMELSGRLFGFNSWSMLVPQALAGVATVGLLYLTVRRWFGVAAGLIAGSVLALTPAAVLMFRYNNPDALLTLLLVAAAYLMTRAVERGSLWWVVATGAALGFGFLTKMLQAFLILPALALVYLVAAPVGLWKRLGHLLAGAGAVVVAAGWWVLTVELWPASSRPYVGGSTNNSILELTFGYNGLGRIFGGDGNPGMGGSGRPPEGGMPGGGAMPDLGGATPPRGGGMAGGSTGVGRLFSESAGGQVSWLLPTALLVLVVGLVLTLRAARTDRTRAALVIWGGWLVVTAAVFSTMAGIFHEYYTVALAPAIGALVGIGCHLGWERRDGWVGRVTMAGMAAVTGGWSAVLLWRTASWYPALRYTVIVLTVVATIGLLLGGRWLTRAVTVGVVAALLAGAMGTGAYAVNTASTAHHGGVPTAGPAAGGSGRFSAGRFPGGASGLPGGAGGFPGGVGGIPDPQASGGGGFGRLPQESSTVDPALVSLLKNTTGRWAAATMTTSGAATLQLASNRPIMGIGGFTSSDPAPTLAQFQRYVSAGKVRYFISTGSGGGAPGNMPGGGAGRGPGLGRNGTVSEITNWVQETFTATTVGGDQVYDLSTPKQ